MAKRKIEFAIDEYYHISKMRKNTKILATKEAKPPIGGLASDALGCRKKRK